MTKKILVVLGTRPEAIKLSLLINNLVNDKRFETKVCVTAQHREMLDQVLNLFEIKPDYDLNIMKSGIDLNNTAAKILTGLNGILEQFKPEISHSSGRHHNCPSCCFSILLQANTNCSRRGWFTNW